MMHHCPYCGTNLRIPIMSGITSCNNCNRVFETSPLNRLLSAAWLIRRRHIQDQDVLMYQFGYESSEAALLQEYVIDGGYSHEDFLHILREMGICLDLVS